LATAQILQTLASGGIGIFHRSTGEQTRTMLIVPVLLKSSLSARSALPPTPEAKDNRSRPASSRHIMRTAAGRRFSLPVSVVLRKYSRRANFS
jgi:hypothetical protein